MFKPSLNPRIISGINETCDNENTKAFLLKILEMESEHSGNWWWKDPFTKLIKHYSAIERGEIFED